MSFGSGLSGVAAANKDLNITGNNIANASTTGFKASRAEFGDAYTTSIMGMGQDPIGSGVNVTNVGQKFEQGNISQTNSVLDLAIDGNGFFVTEYPNNSVTYTRSGIFHVNKQGFIESNQGAVLQGYGVDQNGIVTGILQDLRVDAGNQPPRGTHTIDARLNVPAGAQVLQQIGSTTRTNGLAVGVAQVGPSDDVTTTLDSISYPTTAGTPAQIVGGAIGFTGTTPGINFPWQPNASEASSTLDFTLQGPNINGGLNPLTVTIQPFTDTVIYDDVDDLVSSINANINGDPDLAGKVQAVANSFGGITFETAGPYATDGTAIIGIVNNVNSLSDRNYLNFGSHGITLAGDAASGLNITAVNTGTTLTSRIDLDSLDSTSPFYDDPTVAGSNMVFNANVGGTVYSNQSFTYNPAGYASQAAFVADLNAQVAGGIGTEGSFQLNANRLEFVVTAGGSLGPTNVSFTSVSSTTTSSVGMNELGMTANSSFAPIQTLGQVQNNQLDFSVDGAPAVTVTLTGTNHLDADSLVADINAQIAATSAALDAAVTAYHVGGVLHFARIDTTTAGDTLSVTSNSATSDTYLGISSTTSLITPEPFSPIAGTDLFANNGFIDLSSDPGSNATVQGNNTSGLTFTDFVPGTATELTGAPIPAGAIANGDDGLSINFTVNLGGDSQPGTLIVPAGGWANIAALATDLENEINAQYVGTYGPNAVTITTNASRLVITSNDMGIGPQTISFTPSTSTASTSVVNFGIATTSVPAPTTVLGSPDVPFDNQIEISLDGGTAQRITIPQGTYTTNNELVDQINSLIASNPTLSGEVNVSHVNGRLIFERADTGAFPLDIDVSGTTASQANFGLTSTTKTLGEEPIDRTHSFRVNLAVPLPDEEGRSGSVAISLEEKIYSVDQLAAAINRELAAVPEDEYIGVRAVVGRDADDNEVLQFMATEGGEASQISITNVQAPGDDLDVNALHALLQADQYEAELLTIGEPAITNGYPEQSFVIYDEANDERTNVTIPEGTQASEIASQLSSYAGVTATAETNLTLRAEDYVNGGDMNLYINGQVITANDFQGIVDEINSYSGTSLNSISADLNADTGNIEITSSIGIDISVSIETTNDLDGLTIQGYTSTAPVTLGRGVDAETNARVGGYVDIVLNEGITMIEPDPRVAGLFNGLNDASFEPFVINEFDPDDPESYNETASLTVYDSLGNQHQLQMYYVKDPDDPVRPQALNSWTVYALIDGEPIGDPDASLPFPQNIEPTHASFKLHFNADGTIDEENTGEFLISNWDPVDSEGNGNGAYTSLNVAEGGVSPVPDPNTNSNFSISFGGTTQYGGPFARYDFQQDGYSSGRLKDLEINDDGTIFARYTNGEAQVLGQVALASFANMEGLTPVGQTEWQESFESGDATIGEAGTGLLGTLRSAALEDSTVDLSEQLVHLIIAQRNYQASAKTIETANAVTQTIINLR
ncbi:flagellar hook-basal body complex protein [Reinekea marina]|uniref:Flagellar hook protein FlgE n=1 Tax=Reinekea marina TaxID=1310421 RepID=A0ABV7WUF1_9GAMM|nr:flagellar hook-basal body complex protein [Reinekea marina]MDN3649218.1 flagellar hook-basal body complex protein [Reinekea marina]